MPSNKNGKPKRLVAQRGLLDDAREIRGILGSYLADFATVSRTKAYTQDVQNLYLTNLIVALQSKLKQQPQA